MKSLQIILLLGMAITAIHCNGQHMTSSNKPGIRDEAVAELLLKDYKPRSLHKTAETPTEKAGFSVIDVHSHPYPKTPHGIDEWVKTMDRLGVEKTVLLTGQTGRAFDSLVNVYSTYKDRFILFCGFDYTGYNQPGFGPAAIKELERCVAIGAKGVGELGDKGWGEMYSKPQKALGMHPDDARMKPLFDKCAELNLPVSIHVADPVWMYEKMDSLNDGLMNAYKWRLDNKGDIVGHSGMMEVLANVVRENPKVTFIACHYANLSHDLASLAALFDRFPNLYADNSAQYAETSVTPRATAKFYETYADRILYGTDMGVDEAMYKTTFRVLETEDEHFYARHISSYHWSMNGYGLNKAILEKVYRLNASKILRLD